LREAVTEGARLLDEVGEGEAIWLHQGVIRLNEEVMLRLFVQRSWERRVPVFSSEAEYVERGLLFSLFPDYEALGARLGRMVQIASPVQDGLQPLLDTKAILNLRTAKHLGLEVEQRVRDVFDILLPGPG
jgi:putative ABC transport system substrate-binding protein